jgi:hypothetical protein
MSRKDGSKVDTNVITHVHISLSLLNSISVQFSSMSLLPVSKNVKNIIRCTPFNEIA